MATVLHTSIFPSRESFLPGFPFFRKHQAGILSYEVKDDKIMGCSVVSPKATLQNGTFFRRRDLLLIGISTSLSLTLPSSDCFAAGEVKMASVVDDINAYSYLYPVELPDKKFVFKWVESRKPERYSSAAPLSPDARLRIVSERVDIIDNLIISVSVGPPNIEILKSKDKSTWTAKDVADAVLSDKSTLRVTSTQRLAESTVLDAHISDVDGEPYWYYDYLVRKSPTRNVQAPNLYRHYVATTAERDGYLYSLSASTLNKQWDTMGPFLKETVESFRLVPPTENYVPPYKDPWRFWVFLKKETLPKILDGSVKPSQGGGLEIVFNQQLTRLG